MNSNVGLTRRKNKSYYSSKKEIKPKIKNIIIDIDQLNKELRSKSEKYRNFIIRNYAGGYCLSCYEIPTKKVSYDIGDALLVERYCDNCFKYMKKGRSKQVIDKLN